MIILIHLVCGYRCLKSAKVKCGFGGFILHKSYSGVFTSKTPTPAITIDGQKDFGPAACRFIIHSGICILQFPEGVEFNEREKAYLVLGIAGKDNQHLKILSTLAEFIQEGDILQQLFTAPDTEQIYQTFTDRF